MASGIAHTVNARHCSVRLQAKSSDNANTEESKNYVKMSELNDMDVVVYSLLGEKDESDKLCLGAVQEDGVLSPLSAWTDEPAFGDSIEFVVDEVDRFALEKQTEDQRRIDGDIDSSSDASKHAIRIHYLLSEDEVSYAMRQCPRGVHNPHGEESEQVYYIEQQLIDQFEIRMDLKPELETLW